MCQEENNGCACGCGGHSHNDQKLKVVALGDSITWGFPYGPMDSWVKLFSDVTGIETVNRGINGDTTFGMMERYVPDVLDRNPNIVILMGGTNDAFEMENADEIIENLRYMAALSHKNKVLPFIGMPVPCFENSIEKVLEKVRLEIRDIEKSERVPIIDFYSVMLDAQGIPDRSLFNDDSHPNKDGYIRMAEEAITVFKRMFH